MGKGSARRPAQISEEEMALRWEQTFPAKGEARPEVRKVREEPK